MRKLSRICSGLLLAMIVAGLLPTAFAQNVTTGTATTVNPFSDVTTDHVNVDAIDYLKKSGVLQGYPDGSYRPSIEINRAEFTKIIVASLYTDLKGKNCFPDVTDQWFAPYVCEAKTRGIIAGYEDGTFKPGDNIKFSEASKIIANAYGLQAGEGGGMWFKPFVTALESKKDIPLSVEFFDGKVKRDAMAEMIYRLKANVTDKPTRTYSEVVGDDFVMANSCLDLKKRFDEQNAYDNPYAYGDMMYKTGAMEAPRMGAPSPTQTAPAPGATTAAPASADQATGMGSSGTSAGASTDFSTTNIQVAGVDEADVIKNDGKFIYIIKGGDLRIVEAYPSDNLKELVTFTLGEQNETFTPTEMYVDGNQLTVIGSDYKSPDAVLPGTTTPAYPPYYNYNRTKVFVVDITDRTKPLVTRSVEFDGYYNTSRKVGSTLYMVMNYNYSPIIYYDYAQPAMLDSASSGSTGIPSASATSTVPADVVAPKMLDTKNGKDELVAPCSQIRILPKEHNFNYLITAAVPLNDLTKDVSRGVVVGSSDNIYASQGNLYVTANDWGGGYYRPYGDYGTSIYRFALGNGTIEYKNKGKVPGQLLNQFSMDESGGYFRIVTTKNETVPGSEINSNVYVIDMNMKLTGKIENIAPGEKLYSARFMGNKAYLVTFKRVDPFFVLDLADPVNPKIAGKLKIPGFSNYLQPYDDTHVLGFGNDVDESKVDPTSDWLPYDAKKGFKMSLFDVTDLANPKEMFKEIIGDSGTYSEVFNNHKALLFDKTKQLLAFPITVYGVDQAADVCSSQTYSTCPASCQKVCVPSSCTYNNGIKVCTADCDGALSCVPVDTSYPKPIFDGAYVYNVNLTDGFKLKGTVTHYNADDVTSLKTNSYTNYEKTIQRLLYIGENLYSVSQGVVKANLLSDMTEKKMIELAGTVYQLYYGKPMPL